MTTPLYNVYVDDDGEVHITDGRSKWDGKAFFLGYTKLKIYDTTGDEISIDQHQKRLRLLRRGPKPPRPVDSGKKTA